MNSGLNNGVNPDPGGVENGITWASLMRDRGYPEAMIQEMLARREEKQFGWTRRATKTTMSR